MPAEAGWEYLSKNSDKVPGEDWQVRSAMKAIEAKYVLKAIPCQLQLAHKHPLTRGKLTLLPSPPGEG